jgi:hypothetical protein
VAIVARHAETFLACAFVSCEAVRVVTDHVKARAWARRSRISS